MTREDGLRKKLSKAYERFPRSGRAKFFGRGGLGQYLQPKASYRRMWNAQVPAIRRAFRAAKLNPKNRRHWVALARWLAWAVYSDKGPGAPKKWTKTRLLRLRDDVAKIKAKEPGFSEVKCCDRLRKEQRYSESAENLMRRLQAAKKLS